MENPIKVLSLVATVFEQLGISYLLVGSLASSIHGMYRSTADINLVAETTMQQVSPLLNALHEDFYVDELAVRDAIDRQHSFNLIHFDSVFKVDIFIPRADEFSRMQFERRELRQLGPDIEQMIYVASAEDTILAKLRWFDSGDRVSTQQWTDVLGIIGASPKRLDLDYLHHWAKRLGLTDLLTKAFKEAQDNA